MGAGHDHGHAHGAPPAGTATAAYRGRLRVALAITLTVMVVEIFGGLLADSLALVADAAHMATDALGLGMALLAIHFAARPPSEKRTFGYARAEILAALANCLLLFVVGGYVLIEAVRRFITPADTHGGLTIAFGVFGLVANTVSLTLLMRGQKDSLNVRGAFLHMAGDAAVSMAVVVGALVIARTRLTFVDPALGLGIAGFILFATWGVLKESIDLSLDAAPKEIDVAKVQDWLAAQPGVVEVHDLHIWAMSTTETALTAHLIRPGNEEGDAFLHQTCEGLAKRFNIGHATLQVERDPASACRLAPAGVV